MQHRVQQKAHETLLRLYQLVKDQLGRPPVAEEFFPVNLELIVYSVLGWQIEKVAQVGLGPDGREALGRCYFDTRKILVARDANKTDGQEAFTIAHEIGHALLHPDVACSTLERAVSYRKASGNQSRQQRAEVEANQYARQLLMPEKAIRKRFAEIFGRDRLWSRESEIAGSKIDQRAASRFQIGPQSSEKLECFAKYLADYTNESFSRSISGYFGVSIAAMGKRLLELGLVYD